MLESDKHYLINKHDTMHQFYLGRQFFADSQYPFSKTDEYVVQIIPGVGVLFKLPDLEKTKKTKRENRRSKKQV